MSRSDPQRLPSLSLEQLLALNDEIAALARAGVPLERGLLQLSGDLPGRLGRAAKRLGQRLEQGEDLAQALRDQGSGVPAVYLAVLQAGSRSGRLTAALEQAATTMRRVNELRRSVGVALLYPLLVIGLAYLLFTFTIVNVTPVVLHAFRDLDLPVIPFLAWFVSAGERWEQWAPWIPLAAVLLLAALWWWTGRAASYRWAYQRGRIWSPWRQPVRLLHAGTLAMLHDMLALLLAHDVPADEAVTLAAAATGSLPLKRDAERLAEQIRLGETSAADRSSLPPMLVWLLHCRRPQSELIRSMERLASGYRERAAQLSDEIGVFMPFWLTIGVGGVTVAFYALLVFAPWCRLLYELGKVQ